MKKIKYILLSLFIFTLIINNEVFGYNLKFLGKYIDPSNTSAKIESVDEEGHYADVYLYFCVKKQTGSGSTSGWNSGVDATFPNGNNVSYDCSFVNFTGLISKESAYPTLSTDYNKTNAVNDYFSSGQEKGVFQTVYDTYSGGETITVKLPGKDENGKQLEKEISGSRMHIC